MNMINNDVDHWDNQLPLDMPQLVNRRNVESPVIEAFSKYVSQKGGNVNFCDCSQGECGVEEPKLPEVTGDPEVDLMNGKFVAGLDEAVMNCPMGVFGNGANLEDCEDQTEALPEAFIDVVNKQPAVPLPSVGPREVVQMPEGAQVAGLETTPVLDPAQALPQNHVEEAVSMAPTFPEDTVVRTESTVSDPVSTASEEVLSQFFDNAEARRQEELEAYEQFMNSVA